MVFNDVFKRATALCGISESYMEENDQSDLKEKARAAVDSVIFDLCGIIPADHITEVKELGPEFSDAAAYGAAMFLSLAFGDTDKSAVFSEIYSGKRSALKSKIATIRDVLPKTEGAV